MGQSSSAVRPRGSFRAKGAQLASSSWQDIDPHDSHAQESMQAAVMEHTVTQKAVAWMAPEMTIKEPKALSGRRVNKVRTISGQSSGVDMLPAISFPVDKQRTEATGTYDDDRKGCCLVWLLTPAAQASISASELQAFHAELDSVSTMLGAEVLETNGAHGALFCGPQPSSVSATPVDCAVRLGQLLCRWAVTRDPPLGLKVGVQAGKIRSVDLDNAAAVVYFGPSLTTARRLAETAPAEPSVHLLPSTKRELHILERLVFSVLDDGLGGNRSYYLEADAEDLTEEAVDDNLEVFSKQAMQKNIQRSHSLCAQISGMTAEEFTKWLQSFSVDTSTFGKGKAKSLSDLYSELIAQRSYLTLNEGVLERNMEIVRITLCATGPLNQEYFLILTAEVLPDGRTRPRNMKLATQVIEGETWQEAVRRKFLATFGVPKELQERIFSLEKSWFKDDRCESPSYPGLFTRYLSHEIRIRIQDPSLPELGKIGLPLLVDFCTTGDDGTMSWKWCRVGDSEATADTNSLALTRLLTDHGLQISEFEPGAFEDLLEQVYFTKSSTLTARGSELLRHVAIAKVWIAADILTVPHVLCVQGETKRRGNHEIKSSNPRNRRPIVKRLLAGETWRETLPAALDQRLGLGGALEAGLVKVDEASYRHSEEIEYSRSFPGLKTIYEIHEVTCWVGLMEQRLGLPQGHDFTVSRVSTEPPTRRRPNASQGGLSRNDSPWVLATSLKGRQAVQEDASNPSGNVTSVTTTVYTWMQSLEAARPVGPVGSRPWGGDPPEKQKLPMPAPLPDLEANSGELAVAVLMRGKTTNWRRARNAATRIRDSDYHCGAFFEDCTAAFPELALYAILTDTTSGRSTSDEYQRTMGSLFSVYWLMRADIDGADSFCYGVDREWKVRNRQVMTSIHEDPAETAKRNRFRDDVDWGLFQEVLVSAGMLEVDGNQKPTEAYDVERVLCMLVLTAIHDIMKVPLLLPAVEEQRKEYLGYKAGDVIYDHDVALQYVLDFYPQALPSFFGLSLELKRTVKFTQCSMDYNMGWLVQAESPPGQLFTNFKQVICGGQASSRDIAFYFLHWLTDLAGAEPNPQEGCEKFVLKFPQPVLQAFLKSFRFTSMLDNKTETEVFEEYLLWRWEVHDPPLGPVPSDVGSIARLRICVMAQQAGQRMLDAYWDLPIEDRHFLDVEMSRTGCKGQRYSIEPIDEAESSECLGPAFLVYYAPAFLQRPRATAAEARVVLMILAEVMRQARSLWPLDPNEADETVLVHIDSLKELESASLFKLKPSEVWVLHRTSQKSAQVRRGSVVDGSLVARTETDIAPLDWSMMRVLTFEDALRRAMEPVEFSKFAL